MEMDEYVSTMLKMFTEYFRLMGEIENINVKCELIAYKEREKFYWNEARWGLYPKTPEYIWWNRILRKRGIKLNRLSKQIRQIIKGKNIYPWELHWKFGRAGLNLYTSLFYDYHKEEENE